MVKKVFTLVTLVLVSSYAHAAPYNFTTEDYIEYGIYFAPRGNFRGKVHKLLDLRFGNIEGYYARYFPHVKKVPSRKQRLKLVTSRGSVRVDRQDSAGVTVTRDTWNERKRSGTKRLEIRFEDARCTNAEKVTSPCVVNLTLTTDAPDVGVARAPRTLEITSSTGLSFRYRTIRTDGGKPLDRAALNRSPVVVNYAWEWRPSVDGE